VDFAQAFATTLRTLRIEKKLSQEGLAERAGLHINSVGLLERGLRQPSLYTVFQLAVALEVSPSRFVQAVEERKPVIVTQAGPY